MCMHSSLGHFAGPGQPEPERTLSAPSHWQPDAGSREAAVPDLIGSDSCMSQALKTCRSPARAPRRSYRSD